MNLHVVYLMAESQMAPVLRQAADRINQNPALPLQFQVEGWVVGEDVPPESQLLAALRDCHVLIVSMINTDVQARRLAQLIAQQPPELVVVFTSQPELMSLNRIGNLDGARLFHDRDYARRVAQHIREKGGVPLPALPAVLLAATPRLEPRLGPEGLGDLWPYARAALYWLNGSVENLRSLFLHLAQHHPRLAAPATGSRSGPGGDFPVPPPVLFPEVGLWHPDAPSLFTDLASYLDWYQVHRRNGGTKENAGRVGLVLFRQYITTGSHQHYAAVIRALEAEGLEVVAGFGGLDNRSLVDKFFAPAQIDVLLNLTGFNLVGGMGNPQPEAAVELLKRLDVPYLVSIPLLFQQPRQWEDDPVGLAPMQTALQVVLPELEGGLEPRVYAGQGADGAFVPVDAHVQRLARRIRRWIRLRRLPAHERRVALTLFSFPPDKGSVGSAAYLDVFRSVYRLLEALRQEGYRVELPESPRALMQAVLGTDEPPAGPAAPEAHVADRLEAGAYRRLVPWHQRLAPSWGPPPGSLDTDGRRLLIKGRELGNVFIGIQPSFGYEGDPMRLLFSPQASPSHSFAAYYAWLEQVWKADVIVHVGTHGALEFMPGKQVGLSPQCYPDLLIGELPHLYFYAVNNPSEATIAKRRSYAACVTYLTPPLGRAGLYRSLAELKAALARLREAASPAIREAAWATIRELMARAGLEDDLAARGVKDLENPDAAERLADYLRELETELIPLGLHVAGQPLSAQEKRLFLAQALAHPRPELELPALPDLLARFRPTGTPAHSNRGNPHHEGEREALEEAVVEALVAGQPEQAWQMVAPGVKPPPEWARLAAFASQFLKDLNPEGELAGLLRGLAGRYIPPSPAGEPATHPQVLPTGRNLHALDPQRVPSPVAQKAGRRMADLLLNRLWEEKGRYPETIALVLWGTDNIKTEGEGVAQALHLLGVAVEPDSRGRMTRLRLVPLEELGRPRIDVVLTVSGIFRDIFPNVMQLLDEAVRLAAAAPEPEAMNFVRKHTLEFSRRLGVPSEQAACRVFSNRPGQYGTGVNHLVDTSQWETSEQLGQLFIERKGFAFGAAGQGRDSRELLAACLATAEAAFQNIDSSEISLADVDHYYEYLGGVSAAVQAAGGSSQPPPVLVGDGIKGHPRVRSLREALQVEARTRLLNPLWYEKMLEHGYQGAHEVAVRLDNTLGWSATTRAVDAWTYRQAAETFLLDEAMRRRLAHLNPRATLRMAQRLLEAAHRGFWEPDERELARLKQAFLELENRVELNPMDELPSPQDEGSSPREKGRLP